MLDQQHQGRAEPDQAAPLNDTVRAALDYVKAGEPARAILALEHLLAAVLASDFACNLLGLLYSSEGRDLEALPLFERALSMSPRRSDILANRAGVLRRLGRLEQALADYEALLRAREHGPDALYQRAFLLHQLGRTQDALSGYETLLSLEPGHVPARSNRAVALFEQWRVREALEACDAVIALSPELAAAWSHRGRCLLCTGRLEEALASYERACSLAPYDLGLHSNRGVALRELGRLDEALAAFDHVLTCDPQHPQALDNRSRLLLLRGDFRHGWIGYGGHRETSLRMEAIAPADPSGRDRPAPAPRGPRVVVGDEHGLGDLIHYARYLPWLRDAGAEVTFVCRKSMRRLIGPLLEGIEVADEVPAPHRFDQRVGLAGLPMAFRTDPGALPPFAPYLCAEAALIDLWAGRLGGDGFKIGCVWQGSADPTRDPLRSFPLGLLAPVAAISGVRCISLQKSTDGAVVAGMRIQTPADDLDAGHDAFIDTAAVIANLDLIISCDSAIAHLAGAMGKPVWVALKHVPDWRWMLDRTDTPWYPTMRLFRQPKPGDWESVCREIVAAAELMARRRLRAEGGSPSCPRA